MKLSHNEVGRYWNENAEAWTHLARMGCDIYRDLVNTPAFMRILPAVNGLKGLDIGCGEGHNTRLVTRRGARMTAFDIASKFVCYAHDENLQENLDISHCTASAVELPFRNSTFDFAVAFMSMMDIPEQEEVFSEVYRVLKPGAFFQFSIIHPCFATRRWKKVFDDNGREVAIECGDYFNPINGEIEEWIFSQTPVELKEKYKRFKVPYFSRTLSDWLNLLVEADFTIEHLNEPYADKEAIKQNAAIADTHIVAYFLIVRCRK